MKRFFKLGHFCFAQCSCVFDNLRRFHAQCAVALATQCYSEMLLFSDPIRQANHIALEKKQGIIIYSYSGIRLGSAAGKHSLFLHDNLV